MRMHETIITLEKDTMERWCSGDPLAWSALSADAVNYIDPLQLKPIQNLKEFNAYLESIQGKVHCPGGDMIDPRLVTCEDAALLSYNYRSGADLLMGTAGEILWNVSRVYFKTGSGWKVAHAHISYVHHQLPDNVEVPIPIPHTSRTLDGVWGELYGMEAAAMERWRKGDPLGFIEIGHPELTYFDTGTPHRINSLEELRAEYVRREGKIFYDVMDFIEPQVLVCGDMAVLAYRFFSTRLNLDGSVASRTPWNCSEVFIRGGGRWQTIHTHWSLISGKRIASPGA